MVVTLHDHITSLAVFVTCIPVFELATSGHFFSYTVGFVSRKRLKPKSGFLTQSKKAQLFSTENSDWRIQSKNSTFSTGSASRKTQSKKLPVEKFSRKSLRLFFEPIASLLQPQNTHLHAHTPTPMYHTAVSYNGADAALAITAVASRCKSVSVTHS